MSFGGAVAAMKQSFEQNRALLKSHRSLKKQLDEKGLSYKKSSRQLKYKEVSPEELELIKAKIRMDAQMDKLRWNIIVAVMVLVGAIACLWILF